MACDSGLQAFALLLQWQPLHAQLQQLKSYQPSCERIPLLQYLTPLVSSVAEERDTCSREQAGPRGG